MTSIIVMSDFQRHYNRMTPFEQQCLGFLRDLVLANVVTLVVAIAILAALLFK